VRESIGKGLAIAGIALIVLFVLFVVNQTAQVVALADRLSPVFGQIVLWFLVGLYALGTGALAWSFLRLPKPLRPPKSRDDPEYPRYLQRLKARLARNPYVAGMPLETEEDIAAALTLLGKRADDATRTAALQVFLTTAISQNGSLDAVAVLAAQSRLVLQIARIYNQRPSLRELAWLYGQVALAALLARQIDDVDLTETLQPLVTSIMTSAAGAVPGLEAATTVFVQSVLTGSANAYVTLRVGVIAKRCCGSLTLADPAAVRKAAFVEALQMMPSVVQQGAKTVGGVITGAMTRLVLDSVKRAGTATVKTTSQVTKQIAQGAREVAATSVDTVRKLAKRLTPGSRAREGGPEPQPENPEASR